MRLDAALCVAGGYLEYMTVCAFLFLVTSGNLVTYGELCGLFLCWQQRQRVYAMLRCGVPAGEGDAAQSERASLGLDRSFLKVKATSRKHCTWHGCSHAEELLAHARLGNDIGESGQHDTRLAHGLIAGAGCRTCCQQGRGAQHSMASD